MCFPEDLAPGRIDCQIEFPVYNFNLQLGSIYDLLYSLNHSHGKIRVLTLHHLMCIIHVQIVYMYEVSFFFWGGGGGTKLSLSLTYFAMLNKTLGQLHKASGSFLQRPFLAFQRIFFHPLCVSHP